MVLSFQKRQDQQRREAEEIEEKRITLVDTPWNKIPEENSLFQGRREKSSARALRKLPGSNTPS